MKFHFNIVYYAETIILAIWQCINKALKMPVSFDLYMLMCYKNRYEKKKNRYDDAKIGWLYIEVLVEESTFLCFLFVCMFLIFRSQTYITFMK